MPSKFQTVIKRARFVVSPYTSTQMQDFAEVLRTSIAGRITSAVNIYDAPAAPLKPGKSIRAGYPGRKLKHGDKPIRDWVFTGQTMRGLKVLSASENRAEIGFSDPVASQRAFYNNRRETQWGVSPRDRGTVVAVMIAAPVVSVKAI